MPVEHWRFDIGDHAAGEDADGRVAGGVVVGKGYDGVNRLPTLTIDDPKLGEIDVIIVW